MAAKLRSSISALLSFVLAVAGLGVAVAPTATAASPASAPIVHPSVVIGTRAPDGFTPPARRSASIAATTDWQPAWGRAHWVDLPYNPDSPIDGFLEVELSEAIPADAELSGGLSVSWSNPTTDLTPQVFGWCTTGRICRLPANDLSASADPNLVWMWDYSHINDSFWDISLMRYTDTPSSTYGVAWSYATSLPFYPIASSVQCNKGNQ